MSIVVNYKTTGVTGKVISDFQFRLESANDFQPFCRKVYETYCAEMEKGNIHLTLVEDSPKKFWFEVLLPIDDGKDDDVVGQKKSPDMLTQIMLIHHVYTILEDDNNGEEKG